MPSKIPYVKLPSNVKFAQSKEQRDKKADRQAFYSKARWQKLRAAFLASNPLCSMCEAEGRLVAGTVAHHKVERLDDPALAMDWDNLESLCATCHGKLHKSKQVDKPDETPKPWDDLDEPR